MLDARDWPLFAVFAAVVREGSFVGAARALGVSKSVVSEQVRTLEERCGARLMERTTRSLRPTLLGQHVCASAAQMLAAVDDVRAVVEAQRQQPVGTLRVAATLDLGAQLVAPTVARLCAVHEGLRAEMFFDDAEIDVVGLGVEVAIRLGVPKDSSFIAHKLADDAEVIVAAPVLWERWHPITRPSQLATAPWLFHHALRHAGMHFHGPQDGDEERVNISTPRLVASTADTLRIFARAGLGFAILPRHLADSDLTTGALLEVLPGWYRRRVGIYALIPSRQFLPRRVSVFLEAIRDATATVRPHRTVCS